MVYSGIGACDKQCFRALAHGQLFKKVLMLRINVLLESGDAPQEFVDRHTSKVRHGVFWRIGQKELAPNRYRVTLVFVWTTERIVGHSERGDSLRPPA